MKQSEGQRIGAEGEDRFRLMLPKGWIPRKFDRDYGEDFHVLVVNGDEVLPGGFTVQVKTEAKVKFKSQSVKLQLEQKDLQFWADPANRLPLFLVVVDLDSGKGYWLFMREYLEKTLKGWKNKTKPTVYVPLANEMDDKVKFMAAVKDAGSYTTRANSLTAEQQIQEHFAELKRFDSRFDYEYHHDGKESRVTLHAKETVDIRIGVKSRLRTVRAAKFARLFKLGELVSFKPGELEVQGSPLFEHLTKSGCSLQMRVDRPLALTVELWNGNTLLTALSHLPGRLTGGQEKLEFNTNMSHSPVSARIGLTGPGRGGMVTIDFNLAQWNRVKISQAKLFEPVSKFLHFVQEATEVRMMYHADGETIKAGNMPASRLKTTSLSDLDRLYQLYFVCDHYKLDPVISLGERTDWNDIEALYHLLRDETCTQTIDDALTLTLNVSKKESGNFLKEFAGGNTSIKAEGQFIYTVMNLTVPFDETRVVVDKIEFADRSKLQVLNELKDDTDTAAIPMRSCKGATQTYSRYVPESPKAHDS